MPVVESKKRNSILGSLALLLGLGAVGLSVVDVAGLPSISVGPWNLPFALAFDVGVAVLALLALLLAGKSVRTGTEIPFAALVVALAAGGVFYIRHKPAPAAPVANHSAATTAPAIVTQTTTPKPVTNGSAHPVVPNVSTAADAAKAAAAKASAAALRQQQLAALKDAKANFAAAQARVITSLNADPAYMKVKAQSAAADLQLKDARLSYPAGDPNLVAISQQALAAKDAMNQYVADAVTKDPDAAAAKAKLDALTQPN